MVFAEQRGQELDADGLTICSKVVADAGRLDALSRPGWELSVNSDCECADDEIWLVHLCSGGRNDRVWVIIGNGATPRDAIDAAIAAQKGTL